MLLYSIQDSPRLQYTCAFIGATLFDEPIEITTDAAKFRAYGGPRINYSTSSIAGSEFTIFNTGLLFEKGISPQTLAIFETNGYTAFFKTNGGDFAFDIFAAIFYLISRYEEYLPHQTDEYHRYAHTESLAYRQGFLHLPLVNIWLDDLKSALVGALGNIGFRKVSFSFLPTYDIDIAFSYRNKGFGRNLGGMLRSLSKWEWESLNDRVAVLRRKKKDPYDAFEWMNTLHQRYHLRPLYFFLLAARPAGYDKNIDPLNAEYRALVRKFAAMYKAGIHPSWQTGDKPGLLKQEISQLKNITGNAVMSGRQHYIRMKLPETYRALLREGITADYSMGYGSINGFRASVAGCFNWYDLEKETSTGLVLYPFCFMDANSFYEQKVAPEAALEELRHYNAVTRKYNGLMITIWHNQFLGTDPLFKGWREMYELFVGEVAGRGQ